MEKQPQKSADQTDIMRVAAHEELLNQWADVLEGKAKALASRLMTHRVKWRAAHPKYEAGDYAPLLLVVRQRGNSLEVRWQQIHKKGMLGERGKMKGVFYASVKKRAERKGGGYNPEHLMRLARAHETDLVMEIETEAEVIRREHALLMLIRHGVTTARNRLDGRDAQR